MLQDVGARIFQYSVNLWIEHKLFCFWGFTLAAVQSNSRLDLLQKQ